MNYSQPTSPLDDNGLRATTIYKARGSWSYRRESLSRCRRHPKLTFWAARRRKVLHRFTTRANMYADHAWTFDACGAATPYRRRRELVSTTPVLTHAQATYRHRFRSAYGRHRSPTEAPCRPSSTRSSASRTDSRVGHGFSVIVTNGAERRRRDLCDSSHELKDAHSCAELEFPRARAPYIARGARTETRSQPLR